MRKPVALIILLVALADVPCVAANKTVYYEPATVELRGTVETKTFPGPPNYTNIKQGDEVPLDNLDQSSVVAASLIQTLSWTDRKVKFIAHADAGVLREVLMRILPLIGAEELFRRGTAHEST